MHTLFNQSLKPAQHHKLGENETKDPLHVLNLDENQISVSPHTFERKSGAA